MDGSYFIEDNHGEYAYGDQYMQFDCLVLNKGQLAVHSI